MAVSDRELRVLIGCWFCLLVAGYATAAYFMVETLAANKQEAALRHEARLSVNDEEPGKTKAETRDLDIDNGLERIDTEAGIYVDRIFDASMRDTRWSADFYIWFRWKGDRGDPGETFQVINGEITRKQLETTFENGGWRYALYRVKTEITKLFDVSRYPRDDHLLTIRIEDRAHQSFDLKYVPDVLGSEISSRVKVPGYTIYRTDLTEKNHSYKTRRGDPRLPSGYKATYSQLIYGISIKRPGWALYFKMFLGIFSAVAIALLAFLISPTLSGPRFGVGVGAFFAGVASTYVISRQIPQSSIIGLTDFVTGVSLVTIFLTLLTSAMSVAIHTTIGKPGLSRRLDVLALIVFLMSYVSLNVAIAGAASM